MAGGWAKTQADMIAEPDRCTCQFIAHQSKIPVFMAIFAVNERSLVDTHHE